MGDLRELDQHKTNILLVDDRYENLVALSAILDRPEYHIVTAVSGPQALSCLLHREFAVVILDVMMPEMDGYEVATLIRQREKTQYTPIIFLTALATDISHIYRGYSAGAVDYLMKPLDVEIVKAKVAVYADLFRSKQQIKEQARTLREVERKAQETQLLLQREESEAWYSTTLKSIGDAVIATDLTGKVRFINPVAESLTGWSLAEAKGKNLNEVFKILNEETKLIVEDPATKVIQTGRVVGLANHTILIHRSGQEFVLEDNGAPIRDEKGNLLGVVVVFRDATEKRRESERKIFIAKASHILLSSLDYIASLKGLARLASSSISDACIFDIFSDENKLERVAIAHRDPSKESLIPKNAEQLTSAQSSNHQSLSQRVIRNGKTIVINFSLDLQLQSSSSEVEDFRYFKKLDSKSCAYLSILLRGTRIGVLTMIRGKTQAAFSIEDIRMLEDLAARTAAAIENSRLYDAAQKAVRLRDEFLSIASHELRTPITPLKLQLQTIKSLAAKKKFDSVPQEKLDQMFIIADRQMERFQKLIEELLDVSRISVGRLRLEKQEFDLSETINEIIKQFSDEIRKAHCQIQCSLVSVVGEWDKLRIEQVLINLLANAMKYGAGHPIEISLKKVGERAQLEVRDYGPGISKTDQKRIFSRFERAASARHFPGLGLGLYITRQILEAHGGSISVESELEKGAAFIVKLPLSQPLSQEEKKEKVA